MSLVADVVQVLLGLAFLIAGGSKLARTRQQQADFGRYRYPPGTMEAVGAAEVLAAAGMLAGLALDVLATAGAALIIGLTGFTLYSRISRIGDPVDRTVVPAVFLVLALIVLLIRT